MRHDFCLSRSAFKAMALIGCLVVGGYVHGYYGPSPMNMMFIPPPAGFNAMLRPKMSQWPIGWYGATPVSRTQDGKPIYAQMPVYGEVPEAFVAPVSFPMGDPRFCFPKYIAFPAEGRARRLFCEALASELDAATRSSRALYSMRMASGEIAAEQLEEEQTRLDAWEKERQIREYDHEREMAHVSKMTRDQYLAAQSRKLERMCNGIDHTDRFVDEDGDIYKVDVNGNVYRLTRDGEPIWPIRE